MRRNHSVKVAALVTATSLLRQMPHVADDVAETLLASVKVTWCCSDDEDSEAAIANAAWSIVKVLTQRSRGNLQVLSRIASSPRW